MNKSRTTMESITICYLVIFVTSPALGLNKDIITPTIDYLRQDNIKTVCLLTCAEKTWTQKFVKTSGNFSIKVSAVNELDADLSNLMQCLQQKYESIGVVIQASCQLFEEVLVLASRNQYLDFRHKWIIYVDKCNISDKTTKFTENKSYQNDITVSRFKNSTSHGNKIFANTIDVLKTLNLSVDTDITVFEKNDVSDYELYEIFNYGKIQGGEIIVKKLGSCDKDSGCKIRNTGYKYYDRWDFGGWSMRMNVVVNVPPKLFHTELLTTVRRSPGVPRVTHRGALILHVIAELHNFSYKYSVAEKWVGNMKLNGNDTDILSGLYFGENDITPVLRYVRTNNGYATEFADFVIPVTFMQTKYYYRIPTTGAGKFENKFLTPFTNGAWLCIVLVISACGLVLLISAKFERRTLSLQYSIFTAIAALCQQSYDDSEQRVRNDSTARKMTIFITGLSCVLVYNYYTSSVVSWLLNGPPPSINSLKELVESPLELILEDIGYSRSWVELPGSYYFNKKNVEVEDAMRQRKIYTKKKGTLLYASVEEGVAKLKSGGYAFHTDPDNANTQISKEFTQSELCELGSLQSMAKTLLYTCLKKNSPYKEFFVWSLARLLERGIFSCMQRRTKPPDVTCQGSSPQALTLGGAAPAFMVLAAGYLFAVIIMFIERYIHKIKKKKSRHVHKARSWKPRKNRSQLY